MKGLFGNECDLEVNLSSSSFDWLHVFCIYLDPSYMTVGVVGQQLKAIFKRFEFLWINSTSSEFPLCFNLNISLHICRYEFLKIDFEKSFIHGVHPLNLPRTCKNITLACNTILNERGREVYSLSSSNKYVSNAWKTSPKMIYKENAFVYPFEEWWPT
jgi:hypothetical protein